jgi:histidinol phosphatase-like PHP family hydrolase
MKYYTVLVAALPLTLASPQTAQKAGPAGTACKALAADNTFPKAEEWKAALPAAVARGPQKALAHPDYRFEVKTPEDVVNAVKFAAKHNIRLSAIASGHDGLGR